MTYQHGVYIEENSTQILTPITSDAGVQVVVGTAPINLLADPSKAVNVPIVAHTLAEAVERLGYSDDFENYTLCQSMFASFQVFNVAPVIFINVLDPETHKETITGASVQVNNKIAKIDSEGVLLSTLVVKSGVTDSTTTYVLGDDYVAAFDEDNKVTISLTADGDAGSETTLKVTYNKLKPSLVTSDDIIGGYDAGAYSGLECVERIYPIHNIVPGILLAPGFSQDPDVYAVMNAKSENINDCFNIMNVADVDCASDAVILYDAANTWKNTNSYINKQTMLCWPMVKVGSKTLYCQLCKRHWKLIQPR